jgi:hypothetical protein
MHLSVLAVPFRSFSSGPLKVRFFFFTSLHITAQTTLFGLSSYALSSIVPLGLWTLSLSSWHLFLWHILIGGTLSTAYSEYSLILILITFILFWFLFIRFIWFSQLNNDSLRVYF